MKPLKQRAYGSIPHLPGSRLGEGDHHVTEGQARIATEKARDKHDLIIVQEKLDGSNVAVAKVQGEILALSRAGYLATTSKYIQHHIFAAWVDENRDRFDFLLHEGERICGEWLAMAHGTRYNLPHEPFVPFDIIEGKTRLPFDEFRNRINPYGFTEPRLIHYGEPYSVENTIKAIQVSGHGALDEVEGAIWRVERRGVVDFLCKFVHHHKQDGKYFEEVCGVTHWNIDTTPYRHLM